MNQNNNIEIPEDNNKIEEQSIEDVKKKKKNYFLFENSSSKNYPFNFNSYSLTDGIIFLLGALLIPFIINISATYGFKLHSQKQRIYLTFISWFFQTIVMTFLWVKHKNKFIQNGGIIPFYFMLFMPIITIIINIFLDLIITNQSYSDLKSCLSQMIAEIICIVLILLTTKGLLKRIINTYKDNTFYIIVPLGILTFFVLDTIFQLIPITKTSSNQDSLDNLLKSVPGIISLGFFTIIIAPILEELTTRHGIFSISSNKWLGLVSSVIYFAGMHVEASGDWQHIILYLGAAIALAFVFLFSNGNVAFTITMHSIINIFSYVYILLHNEHIIHSIF